MSRRGLISRVAAHMRGNVVAYLALFVALSGVAYAGLKPLLDKNGSVDSANIKDESLVRRDLGRGSVGNSELSSKVRHQVGLSATPPADGSYFGTGMSEDNPSKPVVFTTTWKNGKPTQARMTSNAAECVSPDAYQFTQEGPVSWSAFADYPNQQFLSVFQGLSAHQVYLLSAVINGSGGQCRAQGILLQPQG